MEGNEQQGSQDAGRRLADAQLGAAATARESRARILFASTLIAASSSAVLLIGFIRAKLVAVILGPSGVGLMGVYSSILDLALGVASMGVGGSGVRQIAEAAAGGEMSRTAYHAQVLRVVVRGLAVLGALIVFALAPWVSMITFGSEDHQLGITFLAGALFIRVLGIGQGALLQGLRRIKELASLNVIGAALGAIATVALIYLLGAGGVAPSILAGAAIGYATSTYFVRRLAVVAEAGTRNPHVRANDAIALLSLGASFMVSNVVMLGAGYLVRRLVLQEGGLEAAGLYQAAWSISGMYIGFILQSLGTDFYPRLVGVIDDPITANRVVNDQTYVGLLLAAPGVSATIAVSEYLLRLIYSADFQSAAELLRWLCLGVALRAITWPIGYIVVAKNNKPLFIGAELAWAIVNLTLTYFLVKKYGLNGAGIAFFLSYVFHGLLIFPLVRRLTGFSWTRANLLTGAYFLLSLAASFFAVRMLSHPYGVAAALLLTAATSWISVTALLRVAASSPLPRRLNRLLGFLGKKPN